MTQPETPIRWKDDPSAGALVHRLVQAGRNDGPSAAALGAAPAAIASLLASNAASASGIAGEAVAFTAKSTLSGVTFAKWLAVGILAGSAVAIAIRASDLAPRRRLAPVANAVPAPKPSSIVVEQAPVAETSAPQAPLPPARPPPSSRPSLARELALLDAARRALVAGDTGRALRSLDALERLPGRALGPEATVLRVRALLARHDDGEARRLAELFGRNSPNSPQAAVLRSLLAAPRPGSSASFEVPR